MAKANAISHEDAEVLALRALTFLATDPDRLSRFLQLTGLSPGDLHTRADTTEVQAAVLGYLMGNESDLLVFAANAQIEPASIATAFGQLQPDEKLRMQ